MLKFYASITALSLSVYLIMPFFYLNSRLHSSPSEQGAFYATEDGPRPQCIALLLAASNMGKLQRGSRRCCAGTADGLRRSHCHQRLVLLHLLHLLQLLHLRHDLHGHHHLSLRRLLLRVGHHVGHGQRDEVDRRC